MLHVNITRLLNFLVLVSLFVKISAECGVQQKTEQHFAHKVRLLHNTGETSGETAITLAIIVDDGKFYVNKPKNSFQQKFKWYDNVFDITEKRYKVADHPDSFDSVNECNIRRKVRHIDPVEEKEHNIQCYECDSSSGFGEQKSCYDENLLITRKCDASSQCYIDLKPKYIKRGCHVPNLRKKTFYCRCPLCNNKPLKEFLYFNRDTRAWEFDSYRLLTAEVSDPFPCVTCTTKGLNSTADDLCRTGEGVEKTVCGSHSACYTNINLETSEVTRGCIGLPAYNSIYFLCNQSLCNGGSYKNEFIDRKNEHPILRRLLHGQEPCQQVHVIFDDGGFSKSSIVTGNFMLTIMSVTVLFLCNLCF